MGIGGCRVAVTNASLNATIREGETSTDGEFKLELPISGASDRADSLYLIVANTAYRRYVETLLQVPLAENGKLDVRLHPILAISGSVRLIDGTPVSGAKVRLERREWREPPVQQFVDLISVEREVGAYEAETPSTGLYRFAGISPGMYNLRVSAKGLLRQTSRNGVLDMVTHVTVPPPRGDIDLVLERCWYVALRPVNSITGELVRVAKQVRKSVHVQDNAADSKALEEMIGLERAMVVKQEGWYVGILNESRQAAPVEIGFEASGFRDALMRPKPRPVPAPEQWPAPLEVVNVDMEPEPRRTPMEVEVEYGGPTWTSECRWLEMFIRQVPSTVNPNPTAVMFNKKVALTNHRGSLSLLPGKYHVASHRSHLRFKTVMNFEVLPDQNPRLQLMAENDRTPLRITGVSPAGVAMPLMFATVRTPEQPENSPELMHGLPEVDDPYVILLAIPSDRPLNLILVPSGGPCQRGVLALPALPTATDFQDVRVPLGWAFP